MNTSPNVKHASKLNEAISSSLKVKITDLFQLWKEIVLGDISSKSWWNEFWKSMLDRKWCRQLNFHSKTSFKIPSCFQWRYQWYLALNSPLHHLKLSAWMKFLKQNIVYNNFIKAEFLQENPLFFGYFITEFVR